MTVIRSSRSSKLCDLWCLMNIVLGGLLWVWQRLPKLFISMKCFPSTPAARLEPSSWKLMTRRHRNSSKLPEFWHSKPVPAGGEYSLDRAVEP